MSHRRYIAEPQSAPRVRGDEQAIDLSPAPHDQVATTTCYMCACRCGIKVHLQDGRIRYIEGNRDHPVNKGVLCAKGSAGIMTQYSPARLKKPLKRIGERGAGEFKEIEWDEALGLATEWLGRIRATDPKKLAFFTGRDQSQALTGWWAAQFGTPNYAAHGGFCSVNMAAAGLYTIGGSFWEFGEPDWHRTRYFLMFGVAEDHGSNPIKLGLGELKNRPAETPAKFVSVNPVRTGYSAIADEWIGITPGTDGLFVLALVHEVLKADRIDLDFLVRYTNAPWLVIDAPGAADHGLFVRDEGGNPLCFDAASNRLHNAMEPGITPRLIGKVTLSDGRLARPVFALMAERYLDESYAPEKVAEQCGVPASTIRRIAAELAEAAFEHAIEIPVAWTDWAGRRHDKIIGRPVSMHAMRGVSAHSNGFQTCRAIHLLQMLLGSIDCPGGFRYKPPFPKSAPPPAKPAAQVGPMRPLQGLPLGFPMGPEDLLLDPDGAPHRIDKAFSWEAPMAVHGLMHMVIHNAWAGDPYPIDTLFFYMANMAWNSAMNSADAMRMMGDKDADGNYRIPHIIYADAYFSEMVAYADLVFPDTTYLERWDCISLLDRPISDPDGAGDAIRQPVIKADRDVRPFQDVLLDLGARLKLPGMIDGHGHALYPGGLKDYMVWHERRPGIGMLAGWRGPEEDKEGTGEPNRRQLDRYIENGCFWRGEIPEAARFYRFGNRDFFDWAIPRGFLDKPQQIVLQIYSEPLRKFQLAAEGHGTRQPPDHLRARVTQGFDPLPSWYAPFGAAAAESDGYMLHAITQRPMHMYHSWGSQNAWLRQIQARNPLFIARKLGERLGLADGDWVWIESPNGQVKAEIKLMEGVNLDTVWTWNAIGKRKGAWNLSPGAPESTKGFLLNHVISELLPPQKDGHRYANIDPVTGQAAWYDLKVRLRKCAPEEAGETSPSFAALSPPLAKPGDDLAYGAEFRRGRA